MPDASGGMGDRMGFEDKTVIRYHDGDQVVVRMPNGSGFVMKEIRVWNHCDGSQTIEATAVKRFDIEVATPAELHA